MANNQQAWLPEDYELPERESKYMKLVKGTNRFRIMGRPITGYEWWTEDEDGRHPNRFRTKGDLPKDAISEAKHFWAFVVWNVDEETFQILQITQKTIQKAIRSLAADTDWGNPTGYDIVIERTGEDLKTEYAVNPKPAKKLPKEVTDGYKDFACNLEALYDSGDPFTVEETEDKEALPF